MAYPYSLPFYRKASIPVNNISEYSCSIVSQEICQYHIFALAAPSGPPRNISITSTTSTSFTLSWVPPLEPNGIIQGYDVQYYESLKPNEKNIIENLKGSAHTIKELQPWRDYEIRVACQSSGGTGPFSDPVKHRTDPGGRRLFVLLYSANWQVASSLLR